MGTLVYSEVVLSDENFAAFGARISFGVSMLFLNVESIKMTVSMYKNNQKLMVRVNVMSLVH